MKSKNTLKVISSSKSKPKMVRSFSEPKKKVVKKRAKSKSKTSAEAKLIELPNNMPLRAVEKTAVIKMEFDRHFRNSAYVISYVVGLCFILVGTSLAFSYLLNSVSSNQMLGLVGTSGVDTLTSDSSTVLVEHIPSPVFAWNELPPSSVASDFEIQFSLSNAEVRAKVISYPTSNVAQSIDVVYIGENKYSAHIPVSDLVSGLYKVQVYIFPENGEPEFGELSSTFMVESTSASEEDIDATTVVSDFIRMHTEIPFRVYAPFSFRFETSRPTDNLMVKMVSESTLESISLDTVSVVSTSENLFSASVLDGRFDNDTYKLEFYIDGVLLHKSSAFILANGIQDYETDDSISSEIIDESEEVSVPVFSLKLAYQNDGLINDVIKLVLNADDNHTNIELYSRPANSLTSRFVTRAFKSDGQWVFIFDTKNIPNGDYILFAKAESNNSHVVSNKVEVKIQNEVPELALDTGSLNNVDESTVEARPIITITDAPVTNTEISMNSEKPDEVLVLGGDTADEEAMILLGANSNIIDDLFLRYSVAVQSGDQILVDAAETNLDDEIQRLSGSTLDDVSLRTISDDINLRLINKVEEVKGRIESFEQLRKDKSDGDSAKDSDQDGISDVDEISLYKTNPNIPDSDNDGTSDGIEIVRGFNPNDASSEAIIEFESPKESVGLVRDELVIENVVPISRDKPEPNEIAVKTEIRGKALPNSFVTLYIYSSPTVVTIKTDLDGSFVYTFDKELEDGKHDVYVAVTDNAGKIVAHSNPYSFIKKAQAFTPVDAEELDSINANVTLETSDNSYSIVVGIAILTFGVILLMLGIGMRIKNDNEVVVAESEVLTNSFSDEKSDGIAKSSI